jgi:ribosomal protein S18 acetylase RimI-like enzyme
VGRADALGNHAQLGRVRHVLLCVIAEPPGSVREAVSEAKLAGVRSDPGARSLFRNESIEHLPAIAELERINRVGWPPLEAERIGGWELRYSGGYTKRINSANATPQARSLARHLPAIDKRYRERGLEPVFRITPLSPKDSDAVLQAAGYAPLDPSPVMLRPLGDVGPSAHCEIAARASREWRDGFARSQGLTGEARAAHEAILEAIPGHVSHAVVRNADGRAAAFGIAVHTGPAIVISDVIVAEADRRCGHARALVAGLLARGKSTGAAFALLNTRADNAAALALYRSLGFAEVYRYHYRVRSER